jgi:NADH:ubiquinone oxidoreductase subunit 2 (subunit N)
MYILVGIEAGADDGFGHADGAVRVLLGVHAVVRHVGVVVSIGRNQHRTTRADETRPTVVLPPTVPFEVVVVVVVVVGCPMLAGRLSVARRSCSITLLANCETARTWTTTHQD